MAVTGSLVTFLRGLTHIAGTVVLVSGKMLSSLSGGDMHDLAIDILLFELFIKQTHLVLHGLIWYLLSTSLINHTLLFLP